MTKGGAGTQRGNKVRLLGLSGAFLYGTQEERTPGRSSVRVRLKRAVSCFACMEKSGYAPKLISSAARGLLIGNHSEKQGNVSKIGGTDLPNQGGSGKDPRWHVVRLNEKAALGIPQEIRCVHCLFPQAQDGLPLIIQDIAGICPQRYLVLSHGGQSPMCHEIDDSPGHFCADGLH